MKQTLFADLAKSKEDLKKLLTSINLNLEPNSWLYEAYSMVENLADVWDKDNLRKIFLKENNHSKIFTSLYDVSSFYEILNFVKDEDREMLKCKFKKVLEITTPINETTENNEARNTLWELMLFSIFKRINIEASLGNPNPDILVSFNNSHKYYIQCKRIYSNKPKALQRNIYKANKQLERDLIQKDNNSFGLIALSLERPFLSGGLFSEKLMPEFESEKIAKIKIRNIIEGVINNYQKLWKERKIIKNEKITGILFYTRMPSIVGQRKIFSPGSQISVCNTWVNSEFIKSDFENLRSLVEY